MKEKTAAGDNIPAAETIAFSELASAYEEALKVIEDLLKENMALRQSVSCGYVRKRVANFDSKT